MSPMYETRPFAANENIVGFVHQDSHGSVNLAAIYNMVIVLYCSEYQEGRVAEKTLVRILHDALKQGISQVNDISAAVASEATNVLANFKTDFSLRPHLSGPTDFEPNASFILCRILGINVYHGWVLDPEISCYETVKEFSRDKLEEYIRNLEGQDDNLVVCKDVLNESSKQLTSYGFSSLNAETPDDVLALLFHHNRLDIFHKHNGAVFIYVSDEGIRKEMPEALWMLFEEGQENNIYFTIEYLPVKGQPCEQKATEWYSGFLQARIDSGQSCDEKAKEWCSGFLADRKKALKKAERNRAKKDKKKVKMAPQQGQPTGNEVIDSELPPEDGKREEADEVVCKREEADEDNLPPEDGKREDSDKLPPEDGKREEAVGQDDTRNSSPEEAKPAEEVGSSPGKEKRTEAVRSIQEGDWTVPPESSEPSETTVNGGDNSSGELTREAVGSHPSEGQYGAGSSQEEDKTAEANQNQDLYSMAISPEEGKRTKAMGFVNQEDAEGLREEVDDVPVPKGVALDFLSFLTDFIDDDCSKPYFKGIVAAFTSHCPMFYVPYQFIMAHDELLALKIQDNYSRISEDLRKSVVKYLSKNKVHYPDAVLKIIGLPEPKSLQLFLDYVESIILHEHYAVYGEGPEALPSFDSRRMGRGYLGCIVAKFRTGRCWGGEWSEINMKVKNKGTEFVIDCEKDYELTPDLGYLDLTKFSTTVLERLRFDGRLPPYFDELSDDMMLINDCFGNPVKWERFLQLISEPMALKPPLVQASFISNVYSVAHAISNGNPPRYGPLFSRKDCCNWLPIASKHNLLKQVYNYPNEHKTRKFKYLLHSWGVSHWHVFQFSRHTIHHILQYTKGNDLIQKIQDISVISILLSRTIGKAIAKSVKFLVLNCGVDGLFSSVWRHYAGSDYFDKPNGNPEDAAACDMLQGLVESISGSKTTGYVYSEVSIFSGAESCSVIPIDVSLEELQTHLNDNKVKFTVDDFGCLYCGSVKLWKRNVSENKDDGTAIVVEGPYSMEFDSIIFLLAGWLNLEC